MANLARVGPHSRILDPYCGCCSLLLAAAYLQRLQPPRSSVLKHSLRGEDKEGKGEGEGKGEEEGKRTKVGCRQSSGPCLVGVDSCMGADLGPIYSNFAALGLSCVLPSLTLKWDVAECLLQVNTKLHCTALHCTTQHRTALHSTAQHSAVLYCAAQHITLISSLNPLPYPFFHHYLTVFLLSIAQEVDQEQFMTFKGVKISPMGTSSSTALLPILHTVWQKPYSHVHPLPPCQGA